MGLDIYLYSSKYDTNKKELTLKTVGSFRKNQALHNWLIPCTEEIISNNAMYPLNIELVRELLETLEEVILTRTTELFPNDELNYTGDNYGERYWDDVEKLKVACEELLGGGGFGDVYFQVSY